jgi:phospholipase/carboxylesterase
MNRIQHPTKLPGEAPVRPTFRIESGLFSTCESHDASRVFFGPKHYEPNYAYPLIVWLHSPGTDERQLVRIMPTISLRNYVAVAPRGFPPSGAAPCGHGYVWPQTPDHIHEAECRVVEAVETAARKFHVAADRVFLAGFGAGGTMAFRVAMTLPNIFAGVLSICGEFPHGHMPLGRLAESRQLPVFLAVGRDSHVYPPARACEDLRLLHAAGMSIVLRQYPFGQELSEQMLRDVDRWIIEQITGQA